MPIEFRCTSCQKLLRTPDDTAGKQAKCPECGTVLPVPDAATAGYGVSPSDVGPAGSGSESSTGSSGSTAGSNPFRVPPPAADPGQAQESWNPYQSPGGAGMGVDYDASAPMGHVFQPTRMDAFEVLRRTWETYRDNLAICVGAFVLAMFLQWIVSYGLQAVATVGQRAAGNDTIVGILFAIVFVIFNFASSIFSYWLNLGLQLLYLKVGRREEHSIGDVFAAGRYLIPGILATLLLMLAVGCVVLVVAVPMGLLAFILPRDLAAIPIAAGVLITGPIVVVLILMFSQYQLLIIDRNLGPVQALLTSREIMVGNKLSYFGVSVIGMLISLSGLLLCCVGALFTYPFFILIFPIAYLAITGHFAAQRGEG